MRYVIVSSLLMVGCSTSSYVPWNGPSASLDANMKIVVESKTYTPIFIGLNPQAVQNDHDWDVLLYQLDLALARGIVIVDLMFANRSPQFLAMLNQKLGDRKVFITARFNIDDVQNADLNDAWLNRQKQNIFQLTQDISRYLPGRVIGLRPVVMEGGEWFVLPGSVELAHRVTYCQIELAKVIKQYTDSKSLVLYNAGYLFAFSYINGGTHIDYKTLLESPYIDAIVSPYSYGWAREIQNPFDQQSPIDTTALHHKLFITEDDTRTSYAAQDPWKYSQSIDDDITIVKRDIKYVLQHNTGLYFLDLPNTGWFGTVERDADSNRLWDEISIAIHKSEVFEPKIAVLVDRDYIESQPLGTYPYGTFDLAVLNEEQTGLGVRYYLSSDVSDGLVDLNQFQTVVTLR